MQFEEDVLQRFENNPSTITSMVDHAVSVNRHLMWNIEGKQ
jgi:hypothetical protein